MTLLDMARRAVRIPFAFAALGATMSACSSGGSEPAGRSHQAVTGQDSVVAMISVVAPQDSCTQLYSPTVLADAAQPSLFHMWYGGWQDCTDRDQYGNDRIYHSTSTDLAHWTPPAPVITSAANHFNDPSVVEVSYPVGGVPTPLYLMYMTGCGTAADCFATGHNITYGATSFDGIHWSDPQPVIGVNNGLNEGGAWSPSVVKVSDDLLYVYYFVNTADPATNAQVQRATINPQVDFFGASATVPVVAPFHANVDVHRTAAGYEMLYDSGDPFVIRRLVSSDGVTFAPDPSFPGIDGAAMGYRAMTGHAFTRPDDPSQYWLYFGWGLAEPSDVITITAWQMAR